MATGAVLGEEFRALGQWVVAEQRDSAFAGNAVGPRQRLDTLGAALRFFDSRLVGGVAAVLGQGQEREEDDSGEQRTRKADVEAMPEFPAAYDRHQENDQQDESGDNNCAPDFRAPGEKFQELEKKQKVPLG